MAPPPRRILYADDVDAHVEFVRTLLREKGYEVHTARDGQEAIEKVREVQPDLVLLDVLMPRLGGLEACRIIKAALAATETFVPIILVTVKSDVDSKVQGLRIGADDYLTRPFDELELLARVEAMLRIKALQDRIRDSRRELEQLTVTDALTGLANHRYLGTRLRDEFKRAERYADPLSYVLIDVDHFRETNERRGQAFGDFVLRDIARVLRASVREVDLVARSAGDEFVLLLPNTHFSGSLAVAERAWKAISGAPFSFEGSSERVTVSMGISFYPSRDVRSKDDLLRFAQEALDRAKQEGRNKICLYQQFNYFFNPQT
ncbi:MAG TPA: diguanylate cyclase [Myxococcota bacterium]|jgi:diguanylate cyclase (GGDEF)-like protein|nr:diguanylate cyclase [Myxococcota bacterium]